MRIAVVVGTRPEIIKLASLVPEMQRLGLDFDIIHTGQHYDWDLSERHLAELGLPSPTRALGINSSQVMPRLAHMIGALSASFEASGTELVLIEGDTDSALAAAIAGTRMDLQVAHVEAGCRSFDARMPEERNRLVISRCASHHFAPTRTAAMNLLREGVPRSRVYTLGHPIVTLVSSMAPRDGAEGVRRFGVDPGRYVYATLHREENTEDPSRLGGILGALGRLEVPVVMPLHPRTRRAAEEFRLCHLLDDLAVLDPVAYRESLALISSAAAVITDSGGIQQEAYILRTPCLTLRRNTEWPETLSAGANRLVGWDPRVIVAEAGQVLRCLGRVRARWGRTFGTKRAASRIACELCRITEGRRKKAYDPSGQIVAGPPVPALVRVPGSQRGKSKVSRFAQLYFGADGSAQLVERGSAHALIHAPEEVVADLSRRRGRPAERTR